MHTEKRAVRHRGLCLNLWTEHCKQCSEAYANVGHDVSYGTPTKVNDPVHGDVVKFNVSVSGQVVATMFIPLTATRTHKDQRLTTPLVSLTDMLLAPHPAGTYRNCAIVMEVSARG